MSTHPELGQRKPLGDPRIGRREPVTNLAQKRGRLTAQERKGAPPLAEIRARLKAEGLSRHVRSLRDLGNGQRALRLRHNVPERERFELYRLVGLRVREPKQIAIHGQRNAAPASERSHQPRGKAA